MTSKEHSQQQHDGGRPVPTNDFHILPIDEGNKKADECTPQILVGENKDGAAVTTLPGPALVSDQLAAQPVKSSTDLDQRTAALNAQPDPHKSSN
ncbi:hypothetical protein VP01_2962g6 [Puccinia sorghi]|uniref:Uncharacterized protein n=1 Tax=Puccinia sorghi TaxID=27349 RepID=A0A0L6V0V1_9BASI|nr:hypothetical protein VP01_2962g6 [Puccinia sorghi]